MDPDLLLQLPNSLEDWSMKDFSIFLEKINLPELVDSFGRKFLVEYYEAISEESVIPEEEQKTSEEEKKPAQKPRTSPLNLDTLMKIKLISEHDKKFNLPEITNVTKSGLEIKKFNSKNLKNCYVIADNQISSKHAEIIFAENCFLLEDKGSLNGTFINIPFNKKLFLEPGMKIEMGATDFDILEVEKNEITIQVRQQDDNDLIRKYELELKSNVQNIIGSDKNQKNDNYLYVKDELVDRIHAILGFNGDNVYLEPQETKYGVWLDLKEPDLMKKKYVILKNDFIFRISADYHFKIIENTVAVSFKNCSKCNKRKRNTVFLPCKHIEYCFECANKKDKVCPVCRSDFHQAIRIMGFD